MLLTLQGRCSDADRQCCIFGIMITSYTAAQFAFCPISVCIILIFRAASEDEGEV